MAENEGGQERTEEPTAKRLREAREKGQVPRSRELNTFAVLVVGATCLLAFGDHLGAGLNDLMVDALQLDRELVFEKGLLLRHLEQLVSRVLLLLSPLFVAVTVVALLAPILIGGANFSTQALAPKFSKLNPITGLKRVFSVQGLMELVKALGKFFLVTIIAGMAMIGFWGRLLALGEQAVENAIIETGRMAAWIFLIAAFALLLVVVIDVPFQLWNHRKQLKMTLQEVKDELKDTDGKPEVKGRIRQLQQEMARRRMMAEVPKADVVITNPTHFAVAIAYEAATMQAPRLLAKGADEVAAAIRELAETHRIRLVVAPRVARAIYYTTEIGQEIPAGLFVAVARILAYVYQLERQDPEIEMPEDLPVPDDYLDPRSARRARR